MREDDLNAIIDLTRLSAPPPRLQTIATDVAAILKTVEGARQFAELSIGTVVLDEMEHHPLMVPWLKTGHDYHSAEGLETCLLCGNPFSDARKQTLANALDDRLSKLLAELKICGANASTLLNAVRTSAGAWPKKAELDSQLQEQYEAARRRSEGALGYVVPLFEETSRILAARAQQPTTAVTHDLPGTEVIATRCKALEDTIAEQNGIIRKHNEGSADFANRQEDAREAIKKHYLAEGHDKYVALKKAVAEANGLVSSIEGEIKSLEGDIADLRDRLRMGFAWV